MTLFLREKTFQFPPLATFICSVPSFGNVGQLATDVILSTLHSKGLLERIGFIESEHTLPFTGYDSFAADQEFLCMPIEVYSIIGKNIFIIHQRSPCVQGKCEAFSEELLNILNTLTYGHLLVLTGAGTEDIEAAHRGQFFIANTAIYTSDGHGNSHEKEHEKIIPKKLIDLFEKKNENSYINITKNFIENYDVDEISSSDAETEHHLSENDFDSFMILPIQTKAVSNVADASLLTGVNMASSLFTISYKRNNVNIIRVVQEIEQMDARYGNVTILGLFCIEGDNRNDGKALARLILNSYDLITPADKDLPHPTSWGGLFGQPLNEEGLSMFY
mmetsp:Transcript_26719/g.25583  ORF Transcript_26719/g.25583 Transcript_26719/m.25583 type:complete len:333 (-) Transcript_26719:119-1117(-)|eukprot:CAMPEP_0119038844 /NCGR_PEP_ID=MMETSP1177-20130426/8007_1 /TAXON_ID=2985 /ORGANISM="Ochromonas sp, Strain CCMP1899" /LENGTH=332 /DNA_ID=CAMNT_0007001949 /DNA_START=153 /DNA_END=1151 /DNA_ORIENTATION=+